MSRTDSGHVGDDGGCGITYVEGGGAHAEEEEEEEEEEEAVSMTDIVVV